MKYLFLILIITNTAYSKCSFDNISGAERKSERDILMEDSDNPGVRVSINGLKVLNKTYKIGTVDDAIKLYGESICREIDKKNLASNGDIKVMKTDFKGYYIVCDPVDSCDTSKLKHTIQDIKVTIGAGTGNPTRISTSSIDANNYVEGYQKARIKAQDAMLIDDFDAETYLKKRMDDALMNLYGSEALKKGFTLSPEESLKLDKYIDEFRLGNIKNIPSKYLDLIQTIDLMETPFQGSNNFEDELVKALESDIDGLDGNQKKIGSGKYTVDIAKGGDDMILVIKEDGQVVKVVGADAKGLGKMNMLKRMQAYLNRSEGESIYSIAERGINAADDVMDKSMSGYIEKMQSALNNAKGKDIDEIIKIAFDDYHSDYIENGQMQMRTGAINSCGPGTKCVKDRITDIHNTLKLMEKAGIDGHFGDSCIGVEYWSRKLGAKSITQKDVIDE